MRCPARAGSALTAVALLLVAACSPSGAPEQTAGAPASPGAPEPASTATPAAEPALALVATLAPIADLVAQVGGERASVEALVPAGADAHTYEPRPGDVKRFAEADAFFGVGLGLSAGAVRLAEENLPEGAPIVLLGERYLEPDDLARGRDGGHGHSDGHGHAHDGEGDPNPHVWISPRFAMALVEGVVEELAALDPEGAQGYEERGRAYVLELQALDEAIREAVTSVPEGNRRFVTYHDAWAYFARDYGLDAITAVQPSELSEPSAAEVRAIIDLVREHDVPVVFGSEVFPSDVLDAIAEETGAAYVADLADDVLPGEPGDAAHSYVGLMRRNATVIVEALGGDPAPLAARP